jgi:hypothetical protein
LWHWLGELFGLNAKDLRLLRVMEESYGGGYIIVVNLDSRQFLPTPGAPSRRILIKGLPSLRPMIVDSDRLPIVARWYKPDD